MRGLLLRVGMDRGVGGWPAPIFEDGSFEFIPIPEYRATYESKVYVNMVGRNGRRIVDFVPKKLRYSHPHNDPEFVTFTYGDPTKTKRNQLSKLIPRDLLIFYAGLKRNGGKGKARLFVIGYFNVEKVYDFKKVSVPDYHSVFMEMPNNAHSKIFFRLKELSVEFLDKDLVIVKGNKTSSKLLTKALPLGDESNQILQELESIIGYKGSLLRAVGHWIKEEDINKVRKWLEKGET